MQIFRIGQLAALFGVSVQTLRYYDRIGLFSPAGRDGMNGYRYYSAEQVFELMDLLTFKEMGLRLDAIRRNKMESDLDGSLTLLSEKRVDLDREMARLNRLKKRVETKLWRVRKARSLSPGSGIELVSFPERRARSLFHMRLETEDGQEELKARKTTDFVPKKVLDGEVVFSVGLESVLDAGDGDSHEVTVLLLLDQESGISAERVFPSGVYASIVHMGSFESPGEIGAYRRLGDFLTSRGLPGTGPTLEFNLVGGELTSDPEEFMTEIQVYVPGA